MKRTQIYLEEGQDQRLARRAKAVGKTKSDLIREAVSRLLSREPDPSDIERALKDTFGSLPEIRSPSRGKWDRGHG